MFVRNSLYLLREAFRNLLRNSWMTIASIAVVAITLLLLGSFILLNYNIELITENIEDHVE
ncbi:MAG: ABC transporter permease, partial [Firmicutes bacterium]|nr:ABC transporter permease [Bacillota bacterium]